MMLIGVSLLIPKLLCGHGRRQIEGDMMQISHSNHERS